MTLIAIRHIREIGTGDTRPQLFLCEHDGRREYWVLKLMGLANAELAAAWIGSQLARRVGIPGPGVALASVPATALGDAPEAVRRWAQPGPAFGSAYIEPVDAGLIDADLPRFSAATLGAMYAVDAWLEVPDRRKPDGIWNVLQDLRVGSLAVLDYGKRLMPCLGFVLGASDVLLPPDYPAAVRRVASLEAAVETCARMEAISDTEIEMIVAGVPEAWLTEGQRRKIAPFLRGRVERVRAVCERWLGEGGEP